MLLEMSYPSCWVTVPRHMVCLIISNYGQHSTDFAIEKNGKMIINAFPSCFPFFFIFKNIFKISYMYTIKHKI